ncbi:hypothetical protein Tco_0947107, partial [Tanacetum coccineum]
MQTDSSRQSSSRFRQVQSTELQKHGDKREQIRQTADRAATDSDRGLVQCIKMETIGLKAAASISSDSVSSLLGKESIATLRHSSSKCRQPVSNILKCPP